MGWWLQHGSKSIISLKNTGCVLQDWQEQQGSWVPVTVVGSKAMQSLQGRSPLEFVSPIRRLNLAHPVLRIADAGEAYQVVLVQLEAGVCLVSAHSLSKLSRCIFLQNCCIF